MDINEVLLRYQTICASFVGAIVVAVYNVSKIRLDRVVFKRELFASYNKKYDELNDVLERLSHLEIKTARDSEYGEGKSLDELWEELFEDELTPRPELIAAAFDYINLCSEEYYWYKKGYVDEDVWKCWHNGMIRWYQNLYFMQKIVERERRTEAPYYNYDFLDLFPTQK